MQDKKDEHDKQQYEKPALRIINLAVDEVLGISCKTPIQSRPGGFNCMATHCAQKGS